MRIILSLMIVVFFNQQSTWAKDNRLPFKIFITPFMSDPSPGEFVSVQKQTLNSIKDVKNRLKDKLFIVDKRELADIVVVVGEPTTSVPPSRGLTIVQGPYLTTVEPSIELNLRWVHAKLYIPGTDVKEDVSGLGIMLWRNAANETATEIMTWVANNAKALRAR